MFNPVTAPALSPVRHNLLGSANIVTDDKENSVAIKDDWHRGVTFNPTGCYVVEGDCIDCPPSDASDPANCIDAVSFAPMNIELLLEVPSSKDPDKDNKLLEELIEIGTSSRLEYLLWNSCTDTPAGAVGSLVEAATVVDRPWAELTRGEELGLLISALISPENSLGSRGTIHVSPLVAMEMSPYFEERDGGLYTIVGGHQVIVGAYGHDYIIGHVGQVDVYLSEPEFKDGYDSIAANNKIFKQIHRTAVVAWNSCATYAVEILGGS